MTISIGSSEVTIDWRDAPYALPALWQFAERILVDDPAASKLLKDALIDAGYVPPGSKKKPARPNKGAHWKGMARLRRSV